MRFLFYGESCEINLGWGEEMFQRYKEEDVYDTRNYHTNFRNSRNRSIWNLVLDRCSICILYAGWFCNG